MKILFPVFILLLSFSANSKVIDPGSHDPSSGNNTIPEIPGIELSGANSDSLGSISKYAESYFDKKIIQRPKTEINQYLGDLVTSFAIPLPKNFQSLSNLVFKYNSSQFLNLGYGIGFSLEMPRIEFSQDELKIVGISNSGLLISVENPNVGELRLQKILTTLKLPESSNVHYFLNQSGEDTSLYLKIASASKHFYAQIKTNGETWIFDDNGNPSHIFGIKNKGLRLYYTNNRLSLIKDLDALWTSRITYTVNQKEIQINNGTFQPKIEGIKSIDLSQGDRTIRYNFEYSEEYLTKVSEKNSIKTIFQGEYSKSNARNFKTTQERNEIEFKSQAILSYSADLKNLNWIDTNKNEGTLFVDLNGDFYLDKVVFNHAEIIEETNRILKAHKPKCDLDLETCIPSITKEQLETKLNNIPQKMSIFIAVNENGTLVYKKDSTLSPKDNEITYLKFSVNQVKRIKGIWNITQFEPQLKIVAAAKFVDIDGNGKKDILICDYDDNLKSFDINLTGNFTGAKQNSVATSYYHFLKNKSDTIFKENGKLKFAYLVSADRSALKKYSKDLEQGKFHFILNSSKLTKINFEADLACNQMSMPLDYNNDGHADLLTGNKVTLLTVSRNGIGDGKTLALNELELKKLFNMPANDINLTNSPLELLDLKNDGTLSFVESMATYIDRQDRTLVYLQNGMKFKVHRPAPVKLLVKEKVSFGGYSEIDYTYHNGSALVGSIVFSPRPSNSSENSQYNSQINKQPQFKKIYEYGGSRISDQFNILLGHVSSRESTYLIDPISNKESLTRSKLYAFDTDFQNGPLFFLSRARKNGRILKQETYGNDGLLLSRSTNKYSQKNDLGLDRTYAYLKEQSSYVRGNGVDEIKNSFELSNPFGAFAFLNSNESSITKENVIINSTQYQLNNKQYLILLNSSRTTDGQLKKLKNDTLLTYNNEGELVQNQKDGIKHFFDYDSLGRITKNYDQRGKLATYDYHLSSPLVANIQEDGNSLHFDYNFVTNFISQSVKNNFTTTKYKWSNDEILLSLDRNTDNQVVNLYSLTKNGFQFNLKMGDVSKTYSIDGFGRVIKIEKNIDDRIIVEKAEIYNDQDASLWSAIAHYEDERMNVALKYEYDALGRQTKETLSGIANNHHVDFKKLTTFDQLGTTFITETLDDDLSKYSQFAINERGQTIAHVTPSEKVSFNISPVGQILGVNEIGAQYAYDLFGKISSTESSHLPWEKMFQSFSPTVNKVTLTSGEIIFDAYDRALQSKNSSKVASFEQSNVYEQGVPTLNKIKIDDKNLINKNTFNKNLRLINKSSKNLSIDFTYDLFERINGEKIQTNTSENTFNYNYENGQLISIFPYVNEIQYDANQKPLSIEFKNNVILNFQYDLFQKIEGVQVDLNNMKSLGIKYNNSRSGKPSKIYSDATYFGLRQKNKIFQYNEKFQITKTPRLTLDSEEVSYQDSNLHKLNGFKFDYENDLLVKFSHPKYGAFKNYQAPDKSWHATCPESYKDLNECFIKLSSNEYSVKGSYTRAIKVAGKIIAILHDGDVYPALTDHLGSLIALVSPKGDSLVFEREYNEWGEKVSVTGNKELEKNIPWAFAGLVQHPFFNGEILQSETRQYIPSLGLWSTADNLVKWNPNALKELPGNWDALLYASGDPINNTDPTGHATVAVSAGYAVGIAEGPKATSGKYIEQSIGLIAGETKNGYGLAATMAEGKSSKITGLTAGFGFTLTLSFEGKVEDAKGAGKTSSYTLLGFSGSFSKDSNGNLKDLSIGFGDHGFGLAEVFVETMGSMSKLLEIDSKNKIYTRDIE